MRGARRSPQACVARRCWRALRRPPPTDPGWGFWQRPPAQPVIAEPPKVRKIDRAARRAAKQKELAKNSRKVRKDSEKLSGPLHIVISIKKQQLTLYAGGVAVAQSQVSTGVPGHPTPQGVFSHSGKAHLSRVQSLQRRADALHAAHHLVRRRDASGRRAGTSGLARLHPPARRVRKAHVGPHQGRRARHHRAGRGRADRDCQQPAVHRAAAGRRGGAA